MLGKYAKGFQIVRRPVETRRLDLFPAPSVLHSVILALPLGDPEKRRVARLAGPKRLLCTQDLT